MLATLTATGMLPFTVAVGVVVGLLVLELCLAMIGASLLGGDADLDVDTDLDLDADFDVAADPAFDADLDPALELDADVADAPTAASGSVAVLSWLGLGKTPFGVWLAGTLTAFGVSGYVLQTAAASLLGSFLPTMLAVLLVLPVGIALGARFAHLVGRVMPKLETSAINSRSYGGRRGVITVGTAARGRPAQVRLSDAHGNWHYAMVEPFHDHEEFSQGTEVGILRLRDGALRAIRLDDLS
ncbi:MAG: OB-fold-containig protein [Pseudomonadota bacterium]